jgi:hypothetical protein
MMQLCSGSPHLVGARELLGHIRTTEVVHKEARQECLVLGMVVEKGLPCEKALTMHEHDVGRRGPGRQTARVPADHYLF